MKHDPPEEQELAAVLAAKEEAEIKQEEQFVVRGNLEVSSHFCFVNFQFLGTSDQPKQELRLQLAEKIMAASTKTLIKPKYVFRPPPLIEAVDAVYERLKKSTPEAPVHIYEELSVMLPVFQLLTSSELAKAAR